MKIKPSWKRYFDCKWKWYIGPFKSGSELHFTFIQSCLIYDSLPKVEQDKVYTAFNKWLDEREKIENQT